MLMQLNLPECSSAEYLQQLEILDLDFIWLIGLGEDHIILLLLRQNCFEFGLIYLLLNLPSLILMVDLGAFGLHLFSSP
jgi:hypothetical protein